MQGGKPKCESEEIVLKVEELEAMRLKDTENLNQEECAGKMEVSRQTFQNIIDSARKKIAIALTEGKAIQISGGHYTTSFCKFKCLDCGTVYIYLQLLPLFCPPIRQFICSGVVQLAMFSVKLYFLYKYFTDSSQLHQ